MASQDPSNCFPWLRVYLSDLRSGVTLLGVSDVALQISYFPRAEVALQIVECVAIRSRANLDTHTYTHNTPTTPDHTTLFLAPHSLSSHARYRSDTGGLWNVHKLSAKPDLPAVCYVASPKFTKPWATKRYLCVVTSDQRLQLLDPESAEGGFFAIDFRDWRVKTRDDSVLMLTRGDESLLWHIDRCVGVRCALPLGGEITRIQHYNGAVIITSRAVQVYTTHLVPLPFLADDGVNARRRYPKPVLDSIPFGTARILHTSSVPLDSALMPVGGDGAAPCFFAPHDGSLWRLSPDAQLALK